MKRQIYFAFFLLSAITACTTNYQTKNKSITSIKFIKIEHDFGTIKMNSKTSIEFEFENTGNKPLIIHRIITSCECAEPVWSKKPIKPGKTGMVSINYDTSYPGRFIKTLKVYANVENNPVKLKVMGAVE